MAANNSNNEFTNVKREIIKGEQDDVLLEKYPRLKKERIQKKPRPKAPGLKTVKDNGPQVTMTSASLRIEELARPTKQHALMTLKQKMPILPPAFVNNLIRIIEAESCLTPEEAAQTLRRKKRGKKKITPFMKKWVKKITEDIAHASTLDRDATMCQYLMAEHFVKSILGHRCEMRKKEIREIAKVILKRLTSLDGYTTDVQNGDRATQQLRFLADIVACWIAEILIEVGETRKGALEEYFEKRQMKMIEVNDDEQMNNEDEEWQQIGNSKKADQEKDIEKGQIKIEENDDPLNIGDEEWKQVEEDLAKATQEEDTYKRQMKIEVNDDNPKNIEINPINIKNDTVNIKDNLINVENNPINTEDEEQTQIEKDVEKADQEENDQEEIKEENKKENEEEKEQDKEQIEDKEQ